MMMKKFQWRCQQESERHEGPDDNRRKITGKQKEVSVVLGWWWWASPRVMLIPIKWQGCAAEGREWCKGVSPPPVHRDSAVDERAILVT